MGGNCRYFDDFYLFSRRDFPRQDKDVVGARQVGRVEAGVVGGPQHTSPGGERGRGGEGEEEKGR